MRTFSLLSISLLVLGLTACGGKVQNAKPEPSEPAAPEEPQAPTTDSLSSAVSADHVDDPNEPAHGHSSSHDDSNEPPHRD